MSEQKNYDLIIVGGGVVGTSLAIALNHLPLRIALIDALPQGVDDPRLFALHAGSCQLLQNLGIWPDIANGACPIHEVHVSTQGCFGATRLKQNYELGHVIPAQKINQALEQKISAQANLTLYKPAQLKKIWQDNSSSSRAGPSVFLHIQQNHTEHTLQAPIVIAADGTHSTVRTQLAMETEQFDYQQSAIVTITTLARSHQHIAYERFTQKGTIAMLPLMNQQCATIWTAHKDIINNLMALNDEEFLLALQKQFGYRLGRLQSIEKRHTFPLKMLAVKNVQKQSVLILGNAAHTLHPIAAQGLNLALYEIALLAEAIRKKTVHQEPLLVDDLAHTLQAARSQQKTSIKLSHYLANLTQHDSLLTLFARQFGIIALDVFPAAKQQFLRRLTGRGGRVPELMMGSSLDN